MEPITYTDQTGTDQGQILDYTYDLAYGSDEQSFSLNFGLEPRLSVGCLVYIDGTEYGGIIDGAKSDTYDNELTYIGRSWAGILAAKIIMPPSGSDYFTVSGDANQCIETVLNTLDVSDLFEAETASSGIQVNNYQFDRFTDAYSGLRAMLKASGAKLCMTNEQGKVKVYAAAIAAYSDTVDDNLMDFEAQRNWRTVNHLICLGTGELQDRTIVHVFADGNGNISQTQTFYGLDEISAIYDYNTLGASELLEEGKKKLAEMQSEGEIRATINTDAVDVGDVLTARDNNLNLSVTAEVTKKIVKTNNGVLESTYETGAETSPVSSVHTGGDNTGGGVVYTAGAGIDITSGVISAEVTQSELDAVSTTANNAATTAGNAQTAVTNLSNSLATVATSGSYNDLSNTPSIPTATSDLTNDSNFVSDASYVHTDNNFTSTEKSKLSGIAAGAEVNVQSDWNVTSSTSDAYIKNKPNLATVATSGAYSDLSGKPTIPSATSQLSNDSGFITSSDIPTATSSTLGMVKPDNASITISNGVISAAGQGSALDAYPVGSIYMSVNATDPGTLFGGTWARITGKFLLAATDGGNSGASQAAGNTGGEADHTLTTDEMPSHTHVQNQHRHALGRRNIYNSSGSALGVVGYGAGTANDSYTGYTTPTNQNTGGGQAHNNMPPYLAVYVWQRTA